MSMNLVSFREWQVPDAAQACERTELLIKGIGPVTANQISSIS